MAYQMYRIHLIDGSVIEIAEEYYVPEGKGFINHYLKAKDEELFAFGDKIAGFSYVPKKNIVFISTGDVKVVDN